ncbi:Os02g0718600, partial [Oryza sativa Japonica Group]
CSRRWRRRRWTGACHRRRRRSRARPRGARRRRRWPWRALPCCPSSSRVGSCTRQAREVVMDGIGSLMISDLDTARFESFPAIE